MLWQFLVLVQRSGNINKSLFNLNLEVPISCSEKSSPITKSFESNSEWIYSSL